MGISYLFCVTPIVMCLSGLITGLAMSKFKNFRDPRDILKAIGLYVILSIPMTLIFGWRFDYLSFHTEGTVITELISGSILLTILMIGFAKVVRPR